MATNQEPQQACDDAEDRIRVLEMELRHARNDLQKAELALVLGEYNICIGDVVGEGRKRYEVTGAVRYGRTCLVHLTRLTNKGKRIGNEYTIKMSEFIAMRDDL